MNNIVLFIILFLFGCIPCTLFMRGATLGCGCHICRTQRRPYRIYYYLLLLIDLLVLAHIALLIKVAS